MSWKLQSSADKFRISRSWLTWPNKNRRDQANW